jgi:hypothetical protein
MVRGSQVLFYIIAPKEAKQDLCLGSEAQAALCVRCEAQPSLDHQFQMSLLEHVKPRKHFSALLY